MIRLRVGSVITGIITGLLLVFSFFATIPDGKLHITFCDVGQGDGVYIRFPDGKDMVVDGGPGNKIISCLSRHMPFWDRAIDIALLTHPQKDHLDGLLEVLRRYRVQYLVRSDIGNTTEGFDTLIALEREKQVTEKLVTSGETISVGPSTLSILWPSQEQIALMKSTNNGTMRQSAFVPQSGTSADTCTGSSQHPCPSVLGQTTSANLNDGSVVFSLSYGLFDALFPGDADSHPQPYIISSLRHCLLDPIARKDGILEVFKVPHHGSKTGLTDSFLQQIRPQITREKVSFTRPVLVKQDFSLSQKPLAVISVGKNSYGHPAPEIIQKLEAAGFQVMRTDQAGDIEIISDGKEWEVKSRGGK